MVLEHAYRALINVATVELNSKLSSEFIQVFAFNNFVRIVSVSHENISLRSKAEGLAESVLKARNISSGIIARKQAVGFER